MSFQDLAGSRRRSNRDSLRHEVDRQGLGRRTAPPPSFSGTPERRWRHRDAFENDHDEEEEVVRCPKSYRTPPRPQPVEMGFYQPSPSRRSRSRSSTKLGSSRDKNRSSPAQQKHPYSPQYSSAQCSSGEEESRDSSSHRVRRSSSVHRRVSSSSGHGERRRAPPRRSHSSSPAVPPTKTSFALLSDDIVRFQKMVREVSTLLRTSGDNPADTWRTKILVQSSEDLAASIDARLLDNRESIAELDPRLEMKAMAGHQKLARDFKRTYSTFQELVSENREQQLRDIRNLTVLNDAAVENVSSPQFEKKRLERIRQREEEHNIRVMRERETEIRDINRKVHQVNEIFHDLGHFVAGQQEQVDKVEEELILSNAYATVGRQHVEQANKDPFGLARYGRNITPAKQSRDADSPTIQRLRSDRTTTTVRTNSDISHTESVRNADETECMGEVVEEGDFRWSLPFETFSEDLKEVQNDLASLGHQLVGASMNQFQMAKAIMLGCSSAPDMRDYHLDDDVDAKSLPDTSTMESEVGEGSSFVESPVREKSRTSYLDPPGVIYGGATPCEYE